MNEVPHKIRITNDGKMGWQTNVTDAQTGEPLNHLRIDEIHITMREIPHAIVHCQRPFLDIIAETQLEQCVCPDCGRPYTEKE